RGGGAPGPAPPRPPPPPPPPPPPGRRRRAGSRGCTAADPPAGGPPAPAGGAPPGPARGREHRRAGPRGVGSWAPRTTRGAQPPQGDLDGAGDQVRLRVVVLADGPVGMGAGGVEVAQSYRPPAVRLDEILQGVLDGQLRPAVGIDRRLRLGLFDRHVLRDA